MNTTERKDPETDPLIALTMGDPAGIGPEIIAGGWPHFASSTFENRTDEKGRDSKNGHSFRYVVFGRAECLRRAVEQTGLDLVVNVINDLEQVSLVSASRIDVFEVGDSSAENVQQGRVSEVAGDAAYQYISHSITAALNSHVAAIVAAPINKEAIQKAGWDFPGHTEILAERSGVTDFAMMLYIPEGQQVGGDVGLGVVHTTLHQSMRSALDDLTVDNIFCKCQLAHNFASNALQQNGLKRAPRIAVAALNPHAGENGLFGDEEAIVIAPAVAKAKQAGIDCTGPLPCDTLMGRAVAGEFDMVVAMYHDQGHIALKLLGMHKAVNVTLGLPIIRTSVAHGTAFEIAGTGQADYESLLKAMTVAQKLAVGKTGAALA